ncbi:MAG TPA: flagellar basal body rod protein FlgC [Alphaproteobacteria bacterium]|nr:flagellar basal body rod protein FlgC [Alphaproteobacteria bacterium]
MDLMDSMSVSASGMKAQTIRMKVAAENIANANSVVGKDGVNPYQRQIVSFQSVVDSKTGINKVEVSDISVDNKQSYKYEYNPAHPMADKNGLIKLPNISTLKEKTDLKDAARAYEANLSAIDAAKSMMSKSLDMLK